MTEKRDQNREFQVFVKPVGAACNLRCSYCYYIDKLSLQKEAKGLLMNDIILEKYIRQHIEASSDPTVFFSWHGGEPLMAGLEFYRRVVSLQKKFIPPGRTVLNGVQTNGTLIDWDWGWFFKQEKFIAGISIDGPGDLHNNFRRSIDGSETLAKVIKGYEILKSLKVETEILCVVNSYNVRFPLIIYDFFKELGAKYITFLPLIERTSRTKRGVSRASVDPEEFGRFLISVFDEWVEKDIGEIKIQIFEEAARTAFGQDHTLCIFKENCGGVPVIEKDGSFYCCDHFVNAENYLGNINDKSVSELLDSPGLREFGLSKSATLPSFCHTCEVRNMCNGECPKNRFVRTPDGDPGLNYLCKAYKTFFMHCRPFVDAIAQEWKRQGT